MIKYDLDLSVVHTIKYWSVVTCVIKYLRYFGGARLDNLYLNTMYRYTISLKSKPHLLA